MKDYKLEFSLPLEALEEKKISSTPIFYGKVLHVRLDEITLPNGKGAIREYCHHNGAVCVIPICDNGDVLCVRQFRYPFGEPLIEIPAGKLDAPDEDHVEAALRELREETGAHCKALTHPWCLAPGESPLSCKFRIPKEQKPAGKPRKKKQHEAD